MFASIEPFESGMLEVGDSQQIYWECSGNPNGKAVVYLHGGPGTGCSPAQRRYFDPRIYKIVLTDQRGCGRSRPLVETIGDLEVNNTGRLIADLERLREHLTIDRWVVFGASWGSTLAVAYGQAFPNRVSAIVLAAVTTTSRREVRWITHDIGRIFPAQWEKFISCDNYDSSGIDPAQRYAEMVFSKDEVIRERAAREWCAWVDTHVSLSPGYRPNPRFEDKAFRLLFTRLVTHYWMHAAFLDDDQLIRNAALLNEIPGILLHGRYDVSSPLETAWKLNRAWRGSLLRVVEDAGHGGGTMSESIVDAMNHVALI